MKMSPTIFQYITPIAISLLILLLLSVAVSVDGLLIHNEGGASLGGGLAFMFALIVFAIFFFEQVIIRGYKWNIKKVWVVELTIIAIIVIILVLANFEFSYH